MAEWSNAVVLKTIDCYRSGGSNPSFSAKKTHNESYEFFCLHECQKFPMLTQLLFKGIIAGIYIV